MTGQGLYTAPITEGTFHVVATSHADPSKFATVVAVVTTGQQPITFSDGGDALGTTDDKRDAGQTAGDTSDAGALANRDTSDTSALANRDSSDTDAPADRDTGTPVTRDTSATSPETQDVGVESSSGSHVSKDPNGWTVVTASLDTRKVYVSSSQGNDKNDGLSEATPVLTFEQGMSLMRPGYPDWLLLKAGDIWNGPMGVFARFGGRSADEPMLITSYGTGPRPQIRPDETSGACFTELGGEIGSNPHVYFIGLDFYDARKDPRSQSFLKDANGKSTASPVIGIRWIDGGNDILIEDCSFRFLGVAIVIQSNNAFTPQNVRIRRNVIADQYQGDNSQGIYMYVVNDLVIEDNIFDHNGWNEANAEPPTVFSHDLYLEMIKNLTVRGNLFMRDSSLSVGIHGEPNNPGADGIVENNFFFEGEIGMALNNLKGYKVSHNVMLQVNRDNPTGRGLGWGMDLADNANFTINDNIFSDFSFTDNTYAIDLEDSDRMSDITIQDNLIYRVAEQAFIILPSSSWSGIKVTNNTIQDPDLDASAMRHRGPFTAVSYSGNTYSLTTDRQFAAVAKASNSAATFVTYSQWVEQSGETGSRVQTTAFPEPSRNLESYAKSINPSWTLDDFYTAIRTQSKQNWHPEYMAAKINDYIRAGFGLPAFTSTTP